MIQRTRARRIVTTAAVTGLALTAVACSSTSTSTSTTTELPKAFAVALTDTGCTPGTFTVDPGPTRITITNQSGSKSEFEIRTAKPSIVAESEGIAAGADADLDVTLDPGTYDLACGTGEVFTGALVVGDGGDTAGPTDTVPTSLTAVAAAYQAYATPLLDDTVEQTELLSDAIAAGDLAKAKTVYAASRNGYEQLEPVAELFPDLDSAMDARADDWPQAEADPDFTGWHRIEYELFAKGDTAAAAPFAVRLAADAKSLQTQVAALTIDPAVMTGGAAALIEEAAQTKITGEEDRYSGVSLIDLSANVAGSEKIVELLTPLLQAANPTLLTAIQGDFATLHASMDTYESGTTYVDYGQVTAADRAKLQGQLAQLSEDLAQIPGALQIEVK